MAQWGAKNVYLLMLSSWKVSIAKNPIDVMGVVGTLEDGF